MEGKITVTISDTQDPTHRVHVTVEATLPSDSDINAAENMAETASHVFKVVHRQLEGKGA